MTPPWPSRLATTAGLACCVTLGFVSLCGSFPESFQRTQSQQLESDLPDDLSTEVGLPGSLRRHLILEHVADQFQRSKSTSSSTRFAQLKVKANAKGAANGKVHITAASASSSSGSGLTDKQKMRMKLCSKLSKSEQTHGLWLKNGCGKHRVLWGLWTKVPTTRVPSHKPSALTHEPTAKPTAIKKTTAPTKKPTLSRDAIIRHISAQIHHLAKVLQPTAAPTSLKTGAPSTPPTTQMPSTTKQAAIGAVKRAMGVLHRLGYEASRSGSKASASSAASSTKPCAACSRGPVEMRTVYLKVGSEVQNWDVSKLNAASRLISALVDAQQASLVKVGDRLAISLPRHAAAKLVHLVAQGKFKSFLGTEISAAVSSSHEGMSTSTGSLGHSQPLSRAIKAAVANCAGTHDCVKKLSSAFAPASPAGNVSKHKPNTTAAKAKGASVAAPRAAPVSAPSVKAVPAAGATSAVKSVSKHSGPDAQPSKSPPPITKKRPSTPQISPTTKAPSNKGDTQAPSLPPSTARPTVQPSTDWPTLEPTRFPTPFPTSAPSHHPTTPTPTLHPTTARPTVMPSTSWPTLAPTTVHPMAGR